MTTRRTAAILSTLAAATWLGLASRASAQAPPNDLCQNAIVIAEGAHPVSIANATADDGGGGIGCAGVLNGVWFVYTSGAPGTIEFSMCGSAAFDAGMYVFDACGGQRLACTEAAIDCGRDPKLRFEVQADEQFFILVYGRLSEPGDQPTGTLHVNRFGPPPNDACASATPIGNGDSPYSILGATLDGPVNCGRGVASDIWFLYTAPQSGTTGIFTDGTGVRAVSVYDGPSCGVAEPLVCQTGTSTTPAEFEAVASQQYLIQVSGSSGEGTITIRPLLRPANDACADASVIGLGRTDFHLGDATPDGPEEACLGLFPDIWFSFTPDASGTALASLCGSEFDTLLEVYQGECEFPEILVCTDDFCGLQSQAHFPVTAGTSYLIRVGGGNGSGPGTLAMSLLSPPANDACDAAQVIGEGAFPFTTVGATLDGPFEPNCPLLTPFDHDVWFRFTAPRAGDVTFDTCTGTIYDSILFVYSGHTCPEFDGLAAACDDDGCELAGGGETVGGSTVTLRGVAAGAQFLVRAAAHPGTWGRGTLTAVVNPACDVTAPAGATPEPEACGEDSNAGCAGFPEQFTPLPCGDSTVFGTAWADAGSRDTDWYQIVLPVEADIEVEIEAEFPAYVHIRNTPCQGDLIADGVQSTPCGGPGRARIRLRPTFAGAPAPRAFNIAVLPSVFSGYPCGTANDYVLRVRVLCEPTGACCAASQCSITTAGACAAAGGVYQGDNTVCADVEYFASSCDAPFEDISLTGQPGPECNECGIVVPIGFPFRFYGVEHDRVAIDANGFIAFADHALRGGGDFDWPIPTEWSPNNFIAPLMDDLDPFFGGHVTYQTLGSPGNRRFIVQWTNVPQTFVNDSNTFQVILFEADHTIQFRYREIGEPQIPEDFQVGVEGPDGRRGTAYNPSGGLSNRCLRWHALTDFRDCSPPPCRADFDNTNGVQVADIFAFLRAWFANQPSADFDQQNGIQVADIFAFLRAWFAGCP